MVWDESVESRRNRMRAILRNVCVYLMFCGAKYGSSDGRSEPDIRCCPTRAERSGARVQRGEAYIFLSFIFISRVAFIINCKTKFFCFGRRAEGIKG
jgi:hypothetical protein